MLNDNRQVGSPGLQNGIICLMIILLAVVVYGRVSTYEFVNMDDNLLITRNPITQGGLTKEGIIWAFTTFQGTNWNPLTWLSHMLDCHLYGINPGPHHVTSLLLHIANCLLLFVVFRNMTGMIWRSAFVALLFTVHPLQAEPVAWIADRTDVLCCFFWILSLWWYLRYVSSPTKLKYGVLCFVFILGLLSKAMMVTFPCVLLLLDYWPLKRFQVNPKAGGLLAGIPWKTLKTLFLEKLPLILLAVGLMVMTLISHQDAGSIKTLEAYPLPIRVMNALISYAFYIKALLFPTALSVYYTYPMQTIALWQSLLAGVLLAGITGVAVWRAVANPYLFVGWFWFIGTLVPVIGIIQAGSHAMADRYTYIPKIGFILMCVWGVCDILRPFKRQKLILALLAVAAIGAYSAKAYRQVSVWQNTLTLFQNAIKQNPDNYKAHFCIGKAFIDRGQLDNAIAHYQEVLRIKPQHVQARLALGGLYYKEKKFDLAIQLYKEVLRIDADNIFAHSGFGFALQKKGQLAAAQVHFAEILRINPRYPEERVYLGNMAFSNGDFGHAIALYNQAISVKPDFAEAHFYLGEAYLKQQKIDLGIEHYRRAIAVRPGYAEAMVGLGVALIKERRLKEGLDYIKDASQIDSRYLRYYQIARKQIDAYTK